MKRLLTTISTCLVLAAATAQAQTQGVTKDEIVVGFHTDLSGPVAAIGKAGRNAMTMRMDEANAAGGIHGRKIRLVVEDTGYVPQRAVLAVQKMVNQDKIFALVGSFGGALNIASMPVALRSNVPSFMATGSARELYEPTHPLKTSLVTPTSMEFEKSLPVLARQVKATKICLLYQDDEFGQDVIKGAEAGVKSIGTDLAMRLSYKRGETDFSSQVQRMASEKCDMVVLGTLIREMIATVTAARRIGFTPTFLASNAAYSDATLKLGGPALEGLYAVMRAQIPYLDDPATSKEVRAWVAKYKARFDDEPGPYHFIWYTAMDAFVRAATAAGRDLTVENFIKATDRLVIPPDIFGNPEYSWTSTKRLGSAEFRLSQAQGGRWKVVMDYPAFR
jgi:branched-chain amino acid transport system substrate-binding protein